ncbi:MAG: hypothetical protein LBC44_00600 [Mycoplasmataceae bacterium]|nr:hypothetical protein [Mycoplasmataceae bacterium]
MAELVFEKVKKIKKGEKVFRSERVKNKKDFSVDKDGKPSFSNRLETCLGWTEGLKGRELNDTSCAIGTLFVYLFMWFIKEIKEEIEKLEGESK